MMARTAGSKNTKPKTVDPLLAALIARLPTSKDFPIKDRVAWLEMMERAFDVVYGGSPAVSVTDPAILLAKAGDHVEPAKPDHAFYIDKQGYARIAGGDRINAVEVDGDLIDLRGEGDLGTIVWADGSVGVIGKVLSVKPA